MISPPNLLEIESKAPAQFACIFWLLKWADKAHKLDNYDLHICGRDFLKALLKKHNPENSVVIKNIQLIKGYKNIDTLFLLNVSKQTLNKKSQMRLVTPSLWNMDARCLKKISNHGITQNSLKNII